MNGPGVHAIECSDRGFALRWLQPADGAAWDAFVHSHPLGSPYHLTSWRLAIERAFPHIQGGVLALTAARSRRIIAGIPIYDVRSWLLGRRLISVPFAAFCDPLLTPEIALEAFLPAIQQWMLRIRARRFVLKAWRQHPDPDTHGFKVTQRHLHQFIPLDADLESLFRSFSATAVRHMVNRAKIGGVAVVDGSDAACLEAFYQIHAATRARLGLPPLPRLLFESLTDRALPNPASIHLATRNGEPMAGALVLKFRDMVAIEYSGDNGGSRKIGANQLLYWDIIRRAHEAGCTWVSLGRTEIDNPGLRAYKARWQAREEELTTHVLHRATSSGGESHLRSTAKRASRALLRFLPRRVAIWLGHFGYRHLG